MKMNDLYELFVEHTSLKDSMYKTVFIQIQEVLDTIRNIEWLSLSYTVGGDNSFKVDFKKQKVVPLYITEIMKNIFGNYYTFPDGSEITIEFLYEGKLLTIKSIDNDLDVPEEIIHLLAFPSLFDLFIIDIGVKDIFSEFDRIFSFTQQFKQKIDDVYEPLKQKFSHYDSKRRVDSGEVTQSNISGTRVYLENLKKNREKLLTEVNQLDQEIKTYESNYYNVLQLMNSKEGMILDHQKHKHEYEHWSKLFNDYKIKSDSVIDLLVSIDAELQDLVTFDSVDHQDEILYLRDKKIQFEKERDELAKSLNDTKGLMDISLQELKRINNDMTKLAEFNKPQADVIKSKLEELRKLREDRYTELITIEAEVKEQTNRANTESHQLQESKSLSPIITSDSDIIGHLSKPLQPTSVTVVLNYLRYYFAYFTSAIAEQISSQYKDMYPSLVQALACKLTLVKHFGVYFKNMFSIIDFVDDRVEHVNILEA